MMKKLAALFLTTFAFCMATNVAFAESPAYDIGTPPLAVEEALLSPPLPGDTYEDEYVTYWYSPVISTVPAVDEELKSAYTSTMEAIEIVESVKKTLDTIQEGDYEDPQAPETAAPREFSSNPYLPKTSKEFKPWSYARSLLKQGAQKSISFVRVNGRPYIRVSVYLPIPADYPEGMEYDGCAYAIVKNGIMYAVSPTSIDWQQPIF